MSGEIRRLGSIIGATLGSATDQPVAIDSGKYFVTNYFFEDYPGAVGGTFQVWTGPNRTGVKLQSVGFGTATPAPAADTATLRGSPTAPGRVSSEPTLYLSLDAPLQPGLTANIHVLGFDVP